MEELTQRFFDTLLRTQHLPGSAMLAYQRNLLERLIRHARAHVPFYRDTGRLDVLFGPGDQIDWKRWPELPVLPRSQAQASGEALFAEQLPGDCGEVRSGLTSGSTGKPLAYRVNTVMAAANTAILERGLAWAGLPAELRVAWFLNPTAADASGHQAWTRYVTTIRGAEREIYQLPISAPLEQQVEWLAQITPDVIMSYPGVLISIAGALPAAADQHRCKLIICVGEIARPELRAKIESVFGCPTLDLYSASEIGIAAIEDRALGRLLISEETVYVEIRRATELAAEHQDTLAELVMTPLYNYAMPLIRYAAGDFVEVDDAPPPDRRQLRRLKRIVGRTRHFFILPSGQRWWPQVISARRVSEYLSFEQIQYAQIGPSQIELRFVAAADAPLRDEAGLVAALRASTPEAMDFSVRRVTSIPRLPSGKYLDYVCELAGAELDAAAVDEDLAERAHGL